MHEEQLGQNIQKEFLYPWRHDVRGRRPEVNVEYENGHDDGTRDQHHGEEEVLANEGRSQ